jgi:hypothetical protein
MSPRQLLHHKPIDSWHEGDLGDSKPKLQRRQPCFM